MTRIEEFVNCRRTIIDSQFHYDEVMEPKARRRVDELWASFSAPEKRQAEEAYHAMARFELNRKDR